MEKKIEKELSFEMSVQSEAQVWPTEERNQFPKGTLNKPLFILICTHCSIGYMMSTNALAPIECQILIFLNCLADEGIYV